MKVNSLNKLVGSRINGYQILEELEHGASAKVYLAQAQDSQKVVLKSFTLDKKKFFENEKSIYRTFGHKHLVKCLDIFEQYQILVFEYVSNFDLFFYAQNSICEDSARFYIRQIVEVLQYFNQEKVAHRDIKLENILMDENFDIKIIDMGASKHFVSEDKDGLHRDFVGTDKYIAPEILSQNPYELPQTEIFSLGVVLFALVMGSFPFMLASQNDYYYLLLYQGQYEQFWYNHCKKNKSHVSDDLKDLLQKMFIHNPKKRISLQQIQEHPWLLTPIRSETDIKAKIQTIYQNSK